MELVNENFKDMILKLDEIHETLKYPLLTKAAEYREIGFNRLRKGLLDKALESFLTSETLYDTDFVVEMQIGKLYLYGKNEEVDLINLSEAKKHLINAARYAKAERIIQADKKAAEAYFHASVSCYIQSNEEYKAKNFHNTIIFLKEAIDLVEKAISLSPSFDQAYYHKAKYIALLGDSEQTTQMVNSLEKAIILDKLYSLKICADPDFIQFRDYIDNLIRKLRDSTRKQCDLKLLKLRGFIDEMISWHLSDEDILDAQSKISEVEKLLSNNSFLECDQALKILSDKLWDKYEKKLKLHKERMVKEKEDLLNNAENKLKLLENKEYQTFLNNREYQIHKTAVLEFKNVFYDYDTLFLSIEKLQQELIWLEKELIRVKDVKNNSELRSVEREREKVTSVREISNIVAFIICLSGTILLFKNHEKLMFSTKFLFIYLSSAVVITSMLIATMIRSFVDPDVWKGFGYMLVICAVSPILYFVALIATLVVFLIPSLIFPKFFDWAGTVEYLILIVVEWIICFKLLDNPDFLSKLY